MNGLNMVMTLLQEHSAPFQVRDSGEMNKEVASGALFWSIHMKLNVTFSPVAGMMKLKNIASSQE